MLLRPHACGGTQVMWKPWRAASIGVVEELQDGVTLSTQLTGASASVSRTPAVCEQYG